MGLAATCYYAVAKRLPHSRGRHEATGAERFPQLAESPALIDPVRRSAPLVDLLMEALARDADARPTAAELFDRFDELAAQAGIGKVRFR